MQLEGCFKISSFYLEKPRKYGSLKKSRFHQDVSNNNNHNFHHLLQIFLLQRVTPKPLEIWTWNLYLHVPFHGLQRIGIVTFSVAVNFTPQGASKSVKNMPNYHILPDPIYETTPHFGRLLGIILFVLSFRLQPSWPPEVKGQHSRLTSPTILFHIAANIFVPKLVCGIATSSLSMCEKFKSVLWPLTPWGFIAYFQNGKGCVAG